MSPGRPPRLAAIAGASVAVAIGIWSAGTNWLWLVMAAAGAVSVGLAWRADAAGLLRLLRPTARALAVGVLSGVVMVTFTYALYPIVGARSDWLLNQVASHYAALEAPPGPLLALPVLVLVVFAEELVWRGLSIDVLPAEWPRSALIAASAALYALPQLASASFLVIALALVCGAIWSAQRVYSGGLVVPLVTHAIWSVTVFGLVPLEG